MLVNGSCHRRQEEIAVVRRFLLLNEWSEDDNVDRADLVILFACGAFRLNVDEMALKITDICSRLKHGAELLVGGCLPLTDRENLKKIFTGKTITYTDCAALDMLPGAERRFETLPKVYGDHASCPPLVVPGLPKVRTLRLNKLPLRLTRRLLRYLPTPPLRKIVSRLRGDERMEISIAAGCSRTCPYCAKRFARGSVRSKPVDLILQRIAEGTMQGYQRFDLYADSIGDYGQDLGTDFGTLLDKIADCDAHISIGIHDLHPQDFVRYYERIIGLCAAGKVHFLYVITESGNERVLESMHRGIDTFDLVQKLLAVRTYKGVFLQTAIIVGYPGEADHEFEDTVALLNKVDFDTVYVHCYCDMPNTESSRLDGKISHETMSRRLRQIAAAGIKHSVSEARRECDHAFGSGPIG